MIVYQKYKNEHSNDVFSTILYEFLDNIQRSPNKQICDEIVENFMLKIGGIKNITTQIKIEKFSNLLTKLIKSNFFNKFLNTTELSKYIIIITKNRHESLRFFPQK